MSGEIGTGSQQTTFEAMTQFLQTLLDPFAAGAATARARARPAFAEEGCHSAYASQSRKRSGAERDAYGMITKAAPRDPVFDPRWSVWAAGFGGSQTTDGNAAAGSNGSTSRIGGAAVGADYLFSPRTTAGFALAGGGTNFSVNNGGTGRSDLFQAGAFVRHTVGPAYFSAALAYGWQDVTTDRTVTVAGVDQLRARFNANAFSGRIEDGYRFVTPWMGVTPYAAAPVHHVRSAGLCRTGDVGRQYLRAGLQRQERHGCTKRNRIAHRPILGDAGVDLHPARPRRLGARLQYRSLGRRDVPDAAGRVVRRQRRGAGIRHAR